MRNRHTSWRIWLSVLVFAASALSILMPWRTVVAGQAGDDERTGQATVGLDEIVVTARRRAERLSDAPVAVSAFSSGDLERQRITDVTETFGMVPNLFVQEFANSYDRNNLIIRGVGLSTPLNPSVAVFLDGVYMPGNSWQANFLDLERVEVLRGPQGALFGRNTEAGVLNLISKSPQGQFSGRARIDYGSFQTLSGDLYITGPITDGLWFSATGQAKQTDGYTTNIADGTKTDGRSEETLRLALKRPGERLTWTARADLTANRGGFSTIRVVESPSAINQPGEWEEALDFPPHRKRKNHGASLTIDYALESATITSISGWRHQWSITQSDDDYTISPNYGGGPTRRTLGGTTSFWPDPAQRPPQDSDADAFPIPTGFGNLFVFWLEQDALSQEFRIASEADRRLSWLGGVYGYRDKNRQYFERSLTNTSPPVFSQFNGVWYKNDILTEGYSVFGQISYDLRPNLEATIAARYSYEDIEESVYEAFDFRRTDAVVLLRGSYTQDQGIDFDAFIPQGSLTYKWSDDVMAYVNVGQGYKGGGFPRTAPTTAIANIPFKSEFSTNYELGSKATLLGGRFFGSLAVFYIDIKDAQVATVANINGILTPATTNAGKVRSKGFELELMARPIRQLSLRGSVGYTDTYYIQYMPNSATDLAGAKLPNIPEWTGSAGAIYTRPIGSDVSLSFGADYRYVGRQLRGTGVPLDPYYPTPAYDLLNCDISLETDAWNVTVYSTNVLDAYNVHSYTRVGASLLADRTLYPALEKPAGSPRQVGIRVSYSF